MIECREEANMESRLANLDSLYLSVSDQELDYNTEQLELITEFPITSLKSLEIDWNVSYFFLNSFIKIIEPKIKAIEHIKLSTAQPEIEIDLSDLSKVKNVDVSVLANSTIQKFFNTDLVMPV